MQTHGFIQYPTVILPCRDNFNWEVKHLSLNLKLLTLDIKIKRRIRLLHTINFPPHGSEKYFSWKLSFNDIAFLKEKICRQELHWSYIGNFHPFPLPLPRAYTFHSLVISEWTIKDEKSASSLIREWRCAFNFLVEMINDQWSLIINNKVYNGRVF